MIHAKLILIPIKRKPRQLELRELAKKVDMHNVDCLLCNTFSITYDGTQNKLLDDFKQHYKQKHGVKLQELLYAKRKRNRPAK